MKCQFYFLSYVDAALVVYFYKQMFSEIFMAKRDAGQFFWEIIAWKVKFSSTNLHISWRS